MFQLNKMIFFFFSFQYHTTIDVLHLRIIKPLKSNYPSEALISYSRSSTVMKSITDTTHVGRKVETLVTDKRKINLNVNTRLTVITSYFKISRYIERGIARSAQKSANKRRTSYIHLRIYAPQSRLIIN